MVGSARFFKLLSGNQEGRDNVVGTGPVPNPDEVHTLCDVFQKEPVCARAEPAMSQGRNAVTLNIEKFDLFGACTCQCTIQGPVCVPDGNALIDERFRRFMYLRKFCPTGHFIESNHVIVVHD